MRVFHSAIPPALGLAVALALVLFPTPQQAPRRDLERDVEALRQAECEYRGITATFDEVTRAYVLAAYGKGELLGWRGRLSPRNPDTETVVIAMYQIDSVRSGAEPSAAERDALRRKAVPTMGVAWRYSTLAATRIAPANDYAADAVAVFRHTVDGFIARMVWLTDAADLREQPDAASAVLQSLEAGAVLLREDPQEGAVTEADWLRVRVPSSTTTGWLPAAKLRSVSHAR